MIPCNSGDANVWNKVVANAVILVQITGVG